MDETASVVSASPALYSSSPREGKLNADTVCSFDNFKKNSIAAQPHHEEHLITWYGVDEESDEDLLDAFFCQNPGLAEQVTRMKTHRHKRQTDASLVRDYKFSLEVYKLLMERQWEVGLKFILNSLLFSICWAERKRPHLERVNHEIYWAQCALVHKGPKGYRTT